jgi:hypothetical protein
VLSDFSACTKTHAVSGTHSAILLLSVLSSTTHETHVISTEGGVFAAAVERSPHFVVAVAPAFALLRCSCTCIAYALVVACFFSNQPKQSSFRPKAALLPLKRRNPLLYPSRLGAHTPFLTFAVVCSPTFTQNARHLPLAAKPVKPPKLWKTPQPTHNKPDVLSRKLAY